MSDRIIAATRKGLFFFVRNGSGWALESEAFLGSPMTYVFADRRDGALYAAANLGHFGPKLHRSADGGANWEEAAAPAFAKVEDQGGGESNGPSVELIWSMAPGSGGAGDLWAGTIPGGLFRSRDGGASWELNEPLWSMPERERWMGGGYDHPGIHSICVDRGTRAASPSRFPPEECGSARTTARAGGLPRKACAPPTCRLTWPMTR